MLLHSSNNPNQSSSTTTPSTQTPSSPLTTINETWINVFNERTTSKPTFSLAIDPTLSTNTSIGLPGFVLLQHIYAQRAEIIPIYYQLIAFLFRQIPSDDLIDPAEVRTCLFDFIRKTNFRFRLPWKNY